MNEKSKVQTLKFLLLLAILTLTTLILSLKFGLLISIQTTFLMWSFFILCTPLSQGQIALGVPFKFLTKKKFLYPEIYLWIFAFALNVFTYFVTPWVYFNTLITHLLFQVVSCPWPGWLIIITCAIGTFYRFFIGYQKVQASILHKLIRITLIFLGIFVLIYFMHKDLILLLNIRA